MVTRKSIPVLFTSIILSMTATVSALDLDSLLMKSVGGEGAVEQIRRTKSFHSYGRISLYGTPGTFEEHLVPPDMYFMEMKINQLSIVQAYDGHTAWQSDVNGQISAIEGLEKKEILKSLYLGSYSYLLDGAASGKISYLGIDSGAGSAFHEVACTPFENDTVYMYFGADDGLLRRTTGRLDMLVITNQQSDYRQVLDLLFPFHSKASGSGIGLLVEVWVDSIGFNREIDPELFSMPADLVADYRFPKGKSSLKIPFTYRRGHIRLPVKINGRKTVWMILDSGSSSNILNRSAISSLQLEQVSSLPAIGMGGFAKIALVQTDSLNIDGLTLFDQVAGSLPLDNAVWQAENGVEFGGILGYDFLSRFPILIDYAGSTITVFNPHEFVAPPGGTEIDFFLTMKVPTVAGEIIGHPGDFIVDLGNSFGLIIHDRFARANKLDEKLDDIRDNPQSIAGIGGAVSGRSAFAASFKLGDIDIQSLRVLLPDSAAGLAGSERLAGNIGNLVLENFHVLFDYGHRKVIFYESNQ